MLIEITYVITIRLESKMVLHVKKEDNVPYGSSETNASGGEEILKLKTSQTISHVDGMLRHEMSQN